jgi:hypothetical protein
MTTLMIPRTFQLFPRDLTLETEGSRTGNPKGRPHEHPFFGALTPDEWSTGKYKHLDHHLGQFGV